jgi:hypothetical protein
VLASTSIFGPFFLGSWKKQSSVSPQESKPKGIENHKEPSLNPVKNHPVSPASWSQCRASFGIDLGSIPSWHIEGSKITCLQKNQNRRWKKKETLAEPCEKSSENHPPLEHRIVLASASILGRFPCAIGLSHEYSGRYASGIWQSTITFFTFSMRNP